MIGKECTEYKRLEKVRKRNLGGNKVRTEKKKDKGEHRISK